MKNKSGFYDVFHQENFLLWDKQEVCSERWRHGEFCLQRSNVTPSGLFSCWKISSPAGNVSLQECVRYMLARHSMKSSAVINIINDECIPVSWANSRVLIMTMLALVSDSGTKTQQHQKNIISAAIFMDHSKYLLLVLCKSLEPPLIIYVYLCALIYWNMYI